MKADYSMGKILQILREELLPAIGCTEPIALSYAGAVGRQIMGQMPEKAVVFCSGNIIKNVRSVRIPNSGGLVGVEAATILGIIAGNAQKKMAVLRHVTSEDIVKTKRLLSEGFCRIELMETVTPLHIRLCLIGKVHQVEVEIQGTHTNIISLKKDGRELVENMQIGVGGPLEENEELSLDEIKVFADTVEMSLIHPIIEMQIQHNMAIAEKGLQGGYGLEIGKTILETYPGSIEAKMRAYAAAAAEARMDGCELPVIVNSGSGNQGIAASVPVIVYAKDKKVDDERLYRSLVFSALLTIWQKRFIGRLSAFCGAVSAACASGAALAYLENQPLEVIKMTIYNTMANIPGVICDGAKISCAAKIASSLDAAFLAYNLAKRGRCYQPEMGILKVDMQETIRGVGYIGKYGMRQTDIEILKIMLKV